MALGGWDVGTWDDAVWDGSLILVGDDTHDGKYLKKQFDEEKRRYAKRRKDIIAAYERVVEDKPEIAKEIVKPFVKAEAEKLSSPQIDFDKLLANIDETERLWATFLEMDDEDILVMM
jgi:hypothetical protein